MQEPTMIRAKGDGIELQLAVWEGKGKPVICVHGLTANCRCWDVIVQSLVNRHRVLAVDLRGRGLSDKPATGYSEEHHLTDLKCVIDDLNLEEVVLMGHSLGGYISMGFAARHPERVAGLILRATDGILADDDILLPGDSVKKMLAEIPDARVVDITGTNHYSILFQPNPVRDRELLSFLEG